MSPEEQSLRVKPYFPFYGLVWTVSTDSFPGVKKKIIAGHLGEYDKKREDCCGKFYKCMLSDVPPVSVLL